MPVGDPRHRKEVFMGDFRKLAHAVWQYKYHVVWCPKYRFQILKGDVGKAVRDILKELCKWRGMDVLAGSVQVDHVHLVVSIPPKFSVSEAVGFLKGKSAIKIFDAQPTLRRRYWGRHFWTRGYCVSTVGLDEDKIKKYVRWQLKKDQAIDQLKLWKK
jgi:putative transposase